MVERVGKRQGERGLKFRSMSFYLYYSFVRQAAPFGHFENKFGH